MNEMTEEGRTRYHAHVCVSQACRAPWLSHHPQVQPALHSAVCRMLEQTIAMGQPFAERWMEMLIMGFSKGESKRVTANHACATMFNEMLLYDIVQILKCHPLSKAPRSVVEMRRPLSPLEWCS